MKTIYDGVAALIAEHAPDAVALEESYVGADARIALSVGQARGVVLVAAANAGVACREYAPARVKQAICGYGRAEKAQMQRMVKMILGAARAADAEPRRRRARRRDLPRAVAAASAPGGGVVIARLRGKPVANTPRGSCSTWAVSATSSTRRLPPFARATRQTRSRSRRTSTCARTRCSSTASPTGSERELFVQLLAVSGVGPKVALAIVSGSPAAELRRAIVREDHARFQAIPGIGKKTAERIVLELKEKLGDPALAPLPTGRARSTSSRATRSSSSAGRCSTPSAPWPRSTRTCRRRNASGSR